MSWKLVKLGTLVELITKGTTPTSIGYKFTEVGINFVKIESIDLNGNFINNKFAKINEACNEALKRSQLKEGDILFSIAGALGRAAIVSKEILPANTNQAIAIIRLKNSNLISKEFLLKALASESILSQVGNMKAGVAQQNLSLSQLKEFLIPVPPIQIQQKIVVKLDKIFAEIDKATAATEANVKNVETLFKSYLREAYKSDKNWKTVALGDICTIVNGGTPKSEVSEYWDGDLNWTTPKEIGKLTTREITNTERKITEKGIKNSSAKLLPINSVILSSRAPIGHLAINKSLMATNQGCKGLVSSERLNYEYLYYFLSHSKQLLNDMGSGATFKELSGSKLATVEIPLPNLTIQQDVISKINKISSEVSKLNNLYKNKLSDLLFFKQSILKQAFNGELVKAA